MQPTECFGGGVGLRLFFRRSAAGADDPVADSHDGGERSRVSRSGFSRHRIRRRFLEFRLRKFLQHRARIARVIRLFGARLEMDASHEGARRVYALHEMYGTDDRFERCRERARPVRAVRRRFALAESKQGSGADPPRGLG